METCLRGFSYMPEDAKVEVMDLQYIEGKELERAWKTNRRQRLKEQEQKIWDEFVQERDVAETLFKSDPYQFLHELDEDSLKDMMESELQKLKQTKPDSEPNFTAVVVDPQAGGGGDEGDSRPADEREVRVTFEDDEKECDMFHIFDDDVSGAEDEVMVESSPPSSPPTVRAADGDKGGERPRTETKSEIVLSTKSSENVANAIENSIYCARVKDLRIRINDEIIDAINNLEKLEVLALERESAARAKRRAKEFCSRYQTQKLYPLQRQLTDIRRVMRHPAPFGKHTYFQSLMLRVVSLHQNLLVALQVLLRNFEQTYWLVESGTCVNAIIEFTKEGAELHQLDQDLFASCDKLKEAFAKYTTCVTNFFHTGSTVTGSKKSRGRRRTKGSGSTTKAIRADQGSSFRLSMYSADMVRVNVQGNARPSGSRENNAGHSFSKTKVQTHEKGKVMSPKKTSPPRGRRPLMRAPGSTVASRPMQPKDAEVTTMVEVVGTCLSSQITPVGSPQTPLTFRSPRQKLNDRKNAVSPCRKMPYLATPRIKNVRNPSPHKPKTILKALSPIDSEQQDSDSIKLPSFDQVTGQINVKERINDLKEKNVDIKQQNIEIEQQTIEIKEQSIDRKPNSIDKMKPIELKNKDIESKIAKENTKDGSGERKKSNDLKIDLRLNLEETDNDGNKTEDAVSGKTSEIKLKRDSDRSERSSRSKNVAARCEVTRLLKQLCSVEPSGSKNERVSGARNAQLVYVNGGSPRPPSTPQLLKILEETIQKKVPKSMYKSMNPPSRDPEKYRLTFNIQEPTAKNLFQYRTKFVQHMLTSAMYANSAVGKPWEMIGSVSEQILDDVLLELTREIQIKDIIQELYQYEINSE